MFSTAAAHSALETPQTACGLRVRLAALDALEQRGLRPLARAWLRGAAERGEDRLPLGVRRLRLDRRGHGVKPTTTCFVTAIT